MAAVQPPAFLQAGSYSAEHDRRANTAMVRQAGILETGQLAVTQTGTPSMAVVVAAGEVLVKGTQVANQRYYYCYNDGNVTLPIAAANATNPRIDLVIARVNDAQYSGATNNWTLEVVTGTPSATPTAPAVPANSYVLAEVAVAANATSILTGNITNRRQFADFGSSRYSMLHGHRQSGAVGTPPSTIYGFIQIAASQLVTTDANGEAVVPYPTPALDADHLQNFPNGVMTVVATPGQATPAFTIHINHGGHTLTGFMVRLYNLDGTRLANSTVRINYIALGW